MIYWENGVRWTMSCILISLGVWEVWKRYKFICKEKSKKKKLSYRSLPLTLVVDIGSSSIRCSAYALTEVGEPHIVEGSFFQMKSEKFTPHGTANCERIYSSVNILVESCIQFLRSCSLAQNIESIAFSSFVMNLVGLDSKGNPRTPLYTYADMNPSTQKYANQLKEYMSSRGLLKSSSQRTGTPIHVSYFPAQFLRLQAEERGILQSVCQWQTIVGYILTRWTGTLNVPMSYSEASWTGMFDWKNLCWDRNMFRILGVEEDHFPHLMDYNEFQCKFTPSKDFNWPEMRNVRMYLGIGDGAATNVGSKCVNQQNIALTVGTSAAIRIGLPATEVMDTLNGIPDGLWCYRIDKETVLLGGALTDGGSVFEWMQEILKDSPQVQHQVEEMSPDSHGLTILPFLSGERSPGWSNTATGTINGLTRWTSQAHLIRAGIEAVSLQIATILSLLVPLRSPNTAIVASGAALHRSPLWCQIVADATGCKVIVERNSSELTSLGVAMLAQRLHSNPFSNYSLGESILYLPTENAHTVYFKARKRQEKLYNVVVNPSGKEKTLYDD